MKTSIYKKMLRLAAAEIFLQLGFERGSEGTINLCADILEYYTEALIKRIQPFQHVDSNIIINTLISNFYYTEQYQADELVQFIEQQNILRKQLKPVDEQNNNLLHLLRILPPETNFKPTNRHNRNLSIEEKNIEGPSKIISEVAVDDFLNEFIDECNKERSKTTIIEIKDNEKNNEKNNGKDKGKNNGKDNEKDNEKNNGKNNDFDISVLIDGINTNIINNNNNLDDKFNLNNTNPYINYNDDSTNLYINYNKDNINNNTRNNLDTNKSDWDSQELF